MKADSISEQLVMNQVDEKCVKLRACNDNL